MSKIDVQGKEITILSINKEDYISITDIAKHRNPDAPADIVKNWLRTKSTIEFLGLWEHLNNSDFKLVEFDQFKNEAGSNHFVLSPKKWIDQTRAIGLISKPGRYGGTYAHKDIAFEFASWISSPFKLYLIKEFQRLKDEERKQLGWDIRRNLTKINYRIHTDAIKENLIPPEFIPAEPDADIKMLFAGFISPNAGGNREGDIKCQNTPAPSAWARAGIRMRSGWMPGFIPRTRSRGRCCSNTHAGSLLPN